MKDTVLHEIIPAVIITTFFAWIIFSLLEINLHTGIHNWNAIQIFLEIGEAVRK